MSKVIKALVISGRYKGEIVRVSNVSVDEMGRKNAACSLSNGTRANIPAIDLEVIQDKPEPEISRPKTSMPFVSGASNSRTLTHTKNMSKPRGGTQTADFKKCEFCGEEYIGECENCSDK